MTLARVIGVMAAVTWLATGVAVIDLTVYHHPAAMTGVVGAGFCALFLTGLLIWVLSDRWTRDE